MKKIWILLVLFLHGIALGSARRFLPIETRKPRVAEAFTRSWQEYSDYGAPLVWSCIMCIPDKDLRTVFLIYKIEEYNHSISFLLCPINDRNVSLLRCDENDILFVRWFISENEAVEIRLDTLLSCDD